MLRTTLFSLLAAASLLSQAHAADAMPYDETANAKTEVAQALQDATKSGKKMLLVFGANWCKDCRELDKALHLGRTADLVKSKYKLVKVDVGRFDKNLDLAKVYGDPIGKGIPSVVVVSDKNEVVYATRAGELADARGMGEEKIYEFFKTMAAK
ncbi:thioredoxin family protein [Parachitinimonas caeni]|uniref:Thioredoxin family protein n=1 Tax=Parachitinimonas caeni TaxID=3031301 RepID=A0ABT7DUH0_9NEIS|nr:thioredoxin family protein [Parachitinimonas caeni]MDK2123723.1 thioredoxin family protein [Parachitinimonas caeni]